MRASLRTMKRGVLIALASIASAQQPQFQTRAREVLVPVSVTGQRGKPVEGLTASDFTVLSDGQPQPVRMIERDSSVLPIYAVLVVQTNASSEAALAKIQKTASVVSGYITNNMEIAAPSLAAVVTAADEVKLAQDFTASPDLLSAAFKRLSASGDSARILDAANFACDLLASRPQPARRIVVLIGESRDRQSKARFADVTAKAQQDDITIYTISYSAYTTPFTQKASDIPPPAPEPGVYNPNAQGGMNLLAIATELARLAKINVAEALAQSTGGAHDKFTTLHGLETQLSAIGTEVHNRYTLTFVPPEPQSPGYHRLSVALRAPGNFRVHARPGYWTTAE